MNNASSHGGTTPIPASPHMILTGELIRPAVATIGVRGWTFHFIRAIQAVTSPIALAEVADAVVVCTLELVSGALTKV